MIPMYISLVASFWSYHVQVRLMSTIWIEYNLELNEIYIISSYFLKDTLQVLNKTLYEVEFYNDWERKEEANIATFV